MNTFMYMLTVFVAHTGTTGTTYITEFTDFAKNNICAPAMSAADCCWKYAAELQKDMPPEVNQYETVYRFRYCAPPPIKVPEKTVPH